ncbi:MAG: hypothetical protein WCT33_04250 [Patescibacteria group bacterium]
MKKTLYAIGVLLVVGIFAYYAATTLSKNDQNNANANSTVDNEWLTYTQISGLSFDYPANATVWPDGYDVYGSLSIRKNSDFIDNYEEEYFLTRRNVNLEPRTTLTEYVDYMINTSGYQNSKKEIGLLGTTAYQYSNLTETNVYIGTFFQVGDSIYNFYIEQTAPIDTPNDQYLANLSPQYLDEIEATYNRILNSIEIE